ncbi:MAG TPA: PAS domain S-box protein [Terriglobales bacterium]|nr:PAS domain S-box protein [Terriglobales bacterium]
MPRNPSAQRKEPELAPEYGGLPTGILLSSALLEAFPDATVAVDQQGIIIQVNSQTEQLFGYPREELIGQTVELLVPDRYRQQHHQHRGNFAQQPKARRMGAGLDLYGRHRGGSEFPVEISLSPVPTDQGMIVLSAIRDISDRRKIEDELRRLNEELDLRATQATSRLALIMDSSEDAIIAKDLNGNITHWNKGAERTYGYTAEEVIGKSITMLAPKDRANEMLDILERMRRGESVEHFESIRVAKDGRHLDVFISVSPLRDSHGTILGASVIARDITQQKRVEDQFRQAQKMEAVGRLAGGVAHDFNNILGIITACTEFLRDRIEAASPPAQYVETIKRAAQRGASLTRQLLTFSRKQTIRPRVLDLNERLREVNKLLRPLMGDDVEILIVPRSESALIEADPGQIDQIVLNLAVNARDAMPRGGKLILETAVMDFDEAFTCQHPPLKPGKYIMLAVSDTGTGMDEETLAHIFEPFFTTKETGKGTGLGLATVYGIVQQSGGYIWVYSEPGRGTTFRMYLPSAEHRISAAEEAEAEVALPKGDGVTILLVEDDDMMRMLTRQTLADQGYTVLEAGDGRAAMGLLASHHQHIDLVLTDVVMRGLSGPELVLRLSDSHPDMKVVYMSGYTGELLGEHDSLHGNTLLEKPFTRTALLKAINGALA